MLESFLVALMALLKSIPFILTVHGLFLLIILFQFIAIAISLRIILKSGTMKDIKQFLDEYWQWHHLKHNGLILSLWISSLSAYLTLLIVTYDMQDMTIHSALLTKPIQMAYIGVGSVFLLVYTFYRLRDQIEATRVTTVRLKKMRIYTKFKSALRKVQGAPIKETSWGMWVSTLASATEWASEHLVKRQINAEVKDAMVNFAAYAAIEYIVRMSIVGVAVWIVYQ